jgi:hypothetical protein
MLHKIGFVPSNLKIKQKQKKEWANDQMVTGLNYCIAQLLFF